MVYRFHLQNVLQNKARRFRRVGPGNGTSIRMLESISSEQNMMCQDESESIEHI